MVGDRDRPTPAAGRVQARGKGLLEYALGERALIDVVAQRVVPMPCEREQHADGKQDDPSETVVDGQHEDAEDRDNQAAEAQQHPPTIQKPTITTTAIAIAAVSISAPSSLC